MSPPPPVSHQAGLSSGSSGSSARPAERAASLQLHAGADLPEITTHPINPTTFGLQVALTDRRRAAAPAVPGLDGAAAAEHRVDGEIWRRRTSRGYKHTHILSIS